MGHPQIQTRYTAAEYFALEAQSEVRHEYFDGGIFAMAGGTKSHNLIKNNMMAALRASVRSRGCRVYDESVRLAVQDDFHYTYPDVVVTCDPTDRRDPYLIRQPVPIVEVLSPSTAEYDRSLKFNQYKKNCRSASSRAVVADGLGTGVVPARRGRAVDSHRAQRPGRGAGNRRFEPAPVLDRRVRRHRRSAAGAG